MKPINTAWVPRPYMIYVTVKPTRVGPADSIEDAHKKIFEDRMAMSNSFGGLIEPVGTKNRTYHIFKANWERIE